MMLLSYSCVCLKKSCSVSVKPDTKNKSLGLTLLFISLACIFGVIVTIIAIYFVKKRNNTIVDEFEMGILPHADTDSFENISL